MNWTSTERTHDSQLVSLPTSVGKAGATESVAFVAIIWGIVILAAAAD